MNTWKQFGVWARSAVGLLLVASLAVIMTAQGVFALDKVTLKSGEVYEGTILRETDSAVWMKRKVGTVEFEEFVLKEEIASIERDVETPGDATKPRETAQDKEKLRQAVASGATKVAFISCGNKEDGKDMVGMYIYAKSLRESYKALLDLPKEEQPDVVVLLVDSGGGALSETQPLSDVIHLEMKKHFRVVAWVESAISAASFLTFNCEEIYMMPDGHIGGSIAYRMGQGGAEAASGRDLLFILEQGEELSRRGRYDPLVMRAMQSPTLLTADVNEKTGEVKFYDGEGGKHVVSPKGEILTLNSIDADFFGISKGIAATKDELAKEMGLAEWVEVGQIGDEIQHKFREDVKTAETRFGEIITKYNIAINLAANSRGNDRQREIGKARRFLSQLRGILDRAESYKPFVGIDDAWFRQQERLIRNLMR